MAINKSCEIINILLQCDLLSLLLGHTHEGVTTVSGEETLEALISNEEQTSFACTEMVGSSAVAVEPTKELNFHATQNLDANTHEDLFTCLFKEHRLDLPTDSYKLNSSIVAGLDEEWDYNWTGLLSDVIDPLNV